MSTSKEKRSRPSKSYDSPSKGRSCYSSNSISGSNSNSSCLDLEKRISCLEFKLEEITTILLSLESLNRSTIFIFPFNDRVYAYFVEKGQNLQNGTVLTNKSISSRDLEDFLDILYTAINMLSLIQHSGSIYINVVYGDSLLSRAELERLSHTSTKIERKVEYFVNLMDKNQEFVLDCENQKVVKVLNLVTSKKLGVSTC